MTDEATATAPMKQTVAVSIAHNYQRQDGEKWEMWSSVAAMLTEAEIDVLRRAVSSALSLYWRYGATDETSVEDAAMLQRLQDLLAGKNMLKPVE